MTKSGTFPRFLTLAFLAAATLVLFASFSPGTGPLEKDVLKYTNQYRKSKGLGTLQMRSDLNAIARKHSEDMAKGRRPFGHGGFTQREKQIKRMYSSCTMAENVAYGSSTGRDVVTQWKNSSPHRRNLLGDYDYSGIGTARDRNGRIYFTQIFVRR